MIKDKYNKAVIALWLLSLLDMLLTLRSISIHGIKTVEGNPLLIWLYNQSPQLFVISKVLIVSIAVIILLYTSHAGVKVYKTVKILIAAYIIICCLGVVDIITAIYIYIYKEIVHIVALCWHWYNTGIKPEVFLWK